MDGEVVDFNPRKHLPQNKKKKSFNFSFADIDNPIDEEIKDSETLTNTFNTFNVVPYAASGSATCDSLLSWVNAMKTLSSTSGACHNRIKEFALGGKVMVVKMEDPVFLTNTDEKELDGGVQENYIEFVNDINFDYNDVKGTMYDTWMQNGNIWLELVVTETAGVKASSIIAHKTEHCKYIATKKGEPKLVVLSEEWDDKYLKENGEVVALYPNYIDEGNNVKRTIIHVKNGKYKWYGRPMWIGGWLSCYREYQDTTYLVKQSASNFAGQHFIEIEDGDVKNVNKSDEGKSTIDMIEEKMTSKSDDPQSVMLTSRPFGSKEAFIYSFPANNSQGFYVGMRRIYRPAIIENYGWSERLLGNAVSEGFSDGYLSDLKTKEAGVLSNVRNTVDSAMNLAINEVILYFENTELEGIGSRHQTTDEKMVNANKETDIVAKEEV